MFQTVRDHHGWRFFAALPKADRPVALIWWAVLILRGLLPALFAIAMGVLVLHARPSAAAGARRSDGRVTRLVSHRFSTVRMADLIVVLDGARLVEVGTHDDLMAANRHYAELYRIQATGYA